LEQGVGAGRDGAPGRGFQAKDGTLKANGRDVVLPDGRRLFVGSSGTGAPDERLEKQKESTS
jgi:hypothetical protein